MPDDKDNLTSMSGAPIWRYAARDREFEPAISSEDAAAVEAHIERSVAAPDLVFHELVSDLVHIDVHWIKPAKGREFNTLVTTGMSDRPMFPPSDASDCAYAELLIELPPDWPLTDEALKDEKNYWPVRLLKSLARFPHEYETWLWWGHTVPNGDPATPYHASTKLNGCVLAPALNLSRELGKFRCRPDKEVWFFAVIPLYEEEMNLKLRKGYDALFDAFDQHAITELIDPQRPNVAKKGWFSR